MGFHQNSPTQMTVPLFWTCHLTNSLERLQWAVWTCSYERRVAKKCILKSNLCDHQIYPNEVNCRDKKWCIKLCNFHNSIFLLYNWSWKNRRGVTCSFPSPLINKDLGMKHCSDKEDISQRLSAVSYIKIMFQEVSEFSYYH